MHNLAWRVSWQDLKDHFREAGEVVRAEIFTEGPGGRSKGCGIVEMASVDDAAVEKLMDSELPVAFLYARIAKIAAAAPHNHGRGRRPR